MCGVRSDEILSEKEPPGDDGVRSVTGSSFSPLMVASKPKCVSEARRVLNWDVSSSEARAA
jgi:hypothetical protein